MKPIDLSIIIPAYQEAGVIKSSLASLADWLDAHDYGRVEVIVSVADSPDDTAMLAASQENRFQAFRVLAIGPRQGKGHNVREGMLVATGRYRLFMDADLATPLRHLDDVAKLMAANREVGIAVRDLIAIHDGWQRKLITKLGNWLAQIVLLPDIKDTQCGFKVFRQDAARGIFSQITITGWGFDLEALAIARAMGYHIDTFEAPDWHDPKAELGGLVGDSASSAALKTLVDLWRIRLNLWRGRYRTTAGDLPAAPPVATDTDPAAAHPDQPE